MGFSPGARTNVRGEMTAVKRVIVGGIALGLLASACASSGSPPGPAGAGTATRPAASPSVPASASPQEAPTGGATPRFRGAAAVVDPATRARMTASWRPGCPVPIRDLRLLTLDHWGFDGAVHRGELMVHRDQADAVLRVMRALFDAHFPIARMELIDVYMADDNRSMAVNNTSAFNCRAVTGRPGEWSQHAYGRAIDINPIQNPYVSGDTVLPPAGAEYVDRSRRARGMIHPGNAVVRAFEAIGWEWGGGWTSPKDYQHFSAARR